MKDLRILILIVLNKVNKDCKIPSEPTGLPGEGRILDPRWISGLDAPKGMGVHKGRLYVTDINRVAAIDIEYIPGLKLLLVPTFGDNRVMAYELK